MGVIMDKFIKWHIKSLHERKRCIPEIIERVKAKDSNDYKYDLKKDEVISFWENDLKLINEEIKKRMDETMKLEYKQYHKDEMLTELYMLLSDYQLNCSKICYSSEACIDCPLNNGVSKLNPHTICSELMSIKSRIKIINLEKGVL